MYWRAKAAIVLAAAGVTACQACGAATRPAASQTSAPAPAVASRSDVAAPPTAAGDIEFRSAFDLGQTPGPGDLELRGGREAVSAEWPASLYATFTAHGTTAACTAALLG